jgi:hypothetical protein
VEPVLCDLHLVLARSVFLFEALISIQDFQILDRIAYRLRWNSVVAFCEKAAESCVRERSTTFLAFVEFSSTLLPSGHCDLVIPTRF